MKKCVKDLIAGAVLALCSIGYYIASHSIQSFGSNKDFISARTIPVAWAVLLLVLSVVLMVRSYAEISHLKATGEEIFSGRTPKDWLADNYAVIGTFIILFLYAFAMRPVGYLISTFVYLIVQVVLLTQRKKINKKLILKALILAVVFSVLSDYLFVELLSVPLPAGILGF